MTFGDWLRWKRSLADMEAKELARLAHISQQYLCDLECDRRRATVGVCYRLASALGVSPDVVCLRAGHWPSELDMSDVADSKLQELADTLRAMLEEAGKE